MAVQEGWHQQGRLSMAALPLGHEDRNPATTHDPDLMHWQSQKYNERTQSLDS